MIRLEMTESEALLLKEILEQSDHEARFEVARTDTTAYRHKLEGREAVLATLLERLSRELEFRRAG